MIHTQYLPQSHYRCHVSKILIKSLHNYLKILKNYEYRQAVVFLLCAIKTTRGLVSTAFHNLCIHILFHLAIAKLIGCFLTLSQRKDDLIWHTRWFSSFQICQIYNTFPSGNKPRKKHPERGVPFGNNARLSTGGWDNTLRASPPHGEP